MPRTAASAGFSIAQLEQMLDKCRGERQKIERERNKVAKRLAALDARLHALGGGNGRGRGGAGGGGAGTRVRNDKSLVEMIEGVLGKSAKAMNVGDIADAVQKGGYRTNSANFRGIVNQTLIKDKRFTSAARGMYQLKK